MDLASPRSNRRGFTLVELLITLSIAAILTVIAMPSLASLLARAGRQTAQDALHESLVHARETAIMRNTPVMVCPSRDHRSCASWEDWQDGWLIATDSDRDRKPDPGPPLAVFDALPAQMRVLGSSGRPRIVFHADGTAGGSNAQLTICHLGEPGEGSAVTVSNSGRVRESDADPDRLEACLGGTG